MMAALNKPNGALDVIGVGLSVSFIAIFNQFLFLTALCVNFVFRQQQLDLFNKQQLEHWEEIAIDNAKYYSETIYGGQIFIGFIRKLVISTLNFNLLKANQNLDYIS